MKKWLQLCLSTAYMVALLVPACFAQESTAREDFRWNAGDAQELNWNQTIAKSELTKREKTELITAIRAQIGEDRPAAHLDQTQIELIHLNDSKRHEVIAQATGEDLCSPTGNCSLWVFKHGRKGYQVVLDGIAQTFTIQPTITHGWHDIVLGMHGSAFETQLTVYKYDGKAYTSTACYMAIFKDEKDGTKNDDDKAQITDCR